MWGGNWENQSDIINTPCWSLDENMFEESLVTFDSSSDLVNLVGATILVDSNDFKGIHHASRALAEQP